MAMTASDQPAARMTDVPHTPSEVLGSGDLVRFGSHFSVGPTGLTVYGRPSFEQWSWLGYALRVMEQGIQFVIGDWIRLGEEAFGEDRMSQAFDVGVGWSLETCRNYVWVAGKVPPENRRDDLSFTHHQKVAALPHADQRRWLGEAARERWTVGRLTAAIRDAEEAPAALWLLVQCKDAEDADRLAEQMALQGRSCKPTLQKHTTRRRVDGKA